ncbi:MAG: stress response translation initiation inhibitor YciH [Gammaproteobacteria bacterium]|nr:stress response translation initiation inhibitor YciH [Gammaproteobacteria bacterium]MBM4231515.1 stress response translation initiation inhibitor YciH [Gammaproteobacteria bacterium]
MNIDAKRKALAGALVAPHKSSSKEAMVRVGRETQGRGGKGVTVVSGLPLSPSALDDLATQFKKRCGSGGTVRNGVIEIQGDHRDLLVSELTQLGWTAKRSGG